MRKVSTRIDVFMKVSEELCYLENDRPTFVHDMCMPVSFPNKMKQKQIGMTKLELNDQALSIFQVVNIPVEDFDIVFGKPIETVRSSQFCHGTFIRMRNEIIDKLTAEKYK